MLILHLTDFHVTEPGALLGGVDTRAAFSRLMRRVARLEQRPDAILVTGDVAETATDEVYAWTAAALRDLGLPLVVVPGNHDMREPLRRAFRAETGTEPEHLAVARSVAGVRLIALDTLVEGSAHGALGEAQLAWIERELGQAGSEPAVLAMHHPPFQTGLPAMDGIGLLSGGTELARLLEGRANVAGILCGHVHRAITGRFAGLPALIAPSASHQFALDFENAGAFAVVQEPPQLALHRTGVPGAPLTSYLLGV